MTTAGGGEADDTYLILSIVLQSDTQERLKGIHVFLEVAAQN